jgi:uncharacterized protein
MRQHPAIYSFRVFKYLNFFQAILFAHSILAQSVPTPTRNSGNHEALFQLIRYGRTDELNNMLAGGADANDTLQGYSALMAAALNGSVDQMKILIDHGAKVNYQDQNGISALWLAIPDLDKTTLLLDHGADPQLRSKEGYTVLVKLAAIPGTIKIFHLLMERGADLRKSAPDNYLIYNAASSGDTSVLGLLIRAGLKVNDTVSYGDRPINNAIYFRSFETLKMLVDSGADLNTRPSPTIFLQQLHGFTPLMYAALANDRRSFYYLLEHGADPKLRSKSGYTALMLLQQSETDDPEMTLALIKHSALVSAKAPDGTDAMYYAVRSGYTRSLEVLKKYADQ